MLPLEDFCVGETIAAVTWCASNPACVSGVAAIIGGGVYAQSQTKSKSTAKSRTDIEQCPPENQCSAYPSRSVAFAEASNYAGLNASWNKVGWDQFNYPSDKSSQINYTQLRQSIGNDPYGYRSIDGGEVVEHPADGDHPCPHFHAKRNLSGSSRRFPYDPNK